MSRLHSGCGNLALMGKVKARLTNTACELRMFITESFCAAIPRGSFFQEKVFNPLLLRSIGTPCQ